MVDAVQPQAVIIPLLIHLAEIIDLQLVHG